MDARRREAASARKRSTDLTKDAEAAKHRAAEIFNDIRQRQAETELVTASLRSGVPRPPDTEQEPGQ